MKKVNVTDRQEAAINYTVDFFTNTVMGLPKHDLIHKQVKPYLKELKTLRRKLKRLTTKTPRP